MLKWAVAREDRRPNSTKSLRKRRKLLGSPSSHQNLEDCSGELIGGYKLSPSINIGHGSPHPRPCVHRGAARKNCATCTCPTNNYPGNDGDSKSLLYMSLDQLPLAIVKQYERMLQENPGNNNNNSSTVKDCNGNVKSLPLPKNPTSLPFRTKSLENVSHIGTASSNNEVIRQATNRILKTSSSSLLRTTSLASADKRRKNLAIKYFDYKYSNSLSCSSSTTTTSSSGSCGRRSSLRDRGDYPRKYLSFAGPVAPVKSSTLPRTRQIKNESNPPTSILVTSTNNNNSRNNPKPRQPFKVIHNESNSNPATMLPHDLTDPGFLEKSVSFSVPITPLPSIRCARKLTLKRSELRKLEKIRSQTERLNKFLKKYYHDCLPNFPEEEDEHYSPEERVLRTHWTEDKFQEFSQNFMLGNRSSTTSTSSSSTSTSTPPSSRGSSPLSSLISDLENRAIRWRNLKNGGPPLPSNDPSCSSFLLPIIQEDTETSSILSDNCRFTSKEFRRGTTTATNSGRETSTCSDLIGPTPQGAVNTEPASTPGHLVTSTECMELKGDGEPFGEGSFEEKPTRNRTSSPNPSSSSSVGDHYEDKTSGTGSECSDCFSHPDVAQSTHAYAHPEKGTDTDHENANYPSENETWNSHEFSPCETEEKNSNNGDGIPMELQMPLENRLLSSDFSKEMVGLHGIQSTTTTTTTNDGINILEDVDLAVGHALTMSTPKRKITMKFRAKTPTSSTTPRSRRTPRKLVRKPHVTTAYSEKGEVLIRTYCNGDYVTLHVVQAKNLQTCYRSSWKLGLKISLLPEAEETLTKFESIPVNPHRTWVKIDQKFSFEALPGRKVFFTLWKRLEKGRTVFLGWTTLDVGLNKNTQSWFKLRKKKMSTGTCISSKPPFNSAAGTTPAIPATTTTANGFLGKKSGKNQNPTSTTPSKPSKGSFILPPKLTTTALDPDPEMEFLLRGEPKTQLQTSSTMDSGVEDCCSCEPCEPSVPMTTTTTATLPAPTSDSENENDGLGPGMKVRVKMEKSETAGFGFSVVWVSPPRIERLEKSKTADLAGLHIGDLIIGVNGEDVSSVPNTTIYHKMKTTGNELELDVWRKYSPHAESCCSRETPTPLNNINSSPINNNENFCCPPKPPSSFSSSGSGYSSSPSNNHSNNAANNNNIHGNSQCPLRVQPPPVSILKPPPPAPPTCSLPPPTLTSAQPTSTSSNWKIRFNIELLDNEEDDLLKQFFICELKFFRKVVAALDRYLIPAQANHLLSPQEMHLIFSHLIKIITTTKRILQCVATGASRSDWQLGKILFSTHSDHLSELTTAYSQYGKNLGGSAMVLANKMTLQIFAKFVLETPVPKGHLDMTSLVFAPLEHLRNLCEISDEIVQTSVHWTDIAAQLKECYADIVCETDYMEPISHISMKKHPLLSVRDLEKRIVSTTGQNFKVGEKGRKWIFGSRLFRKESDGSWAPVWAFLFSDIIVLTSHTTRDRVFFVKEPPIRLEDVVTLHFNLPRKNENEFRLLFGPELPHQSRLDKLLPMKNRNKKPLQIVLRTSNPQLKSVWKLLLQRQIITLNTRISKSSSSNFSISEFCEKFPDENHSSPIEEELPGETDKDKGVNSSAATADGPSIPDNVKCQVQMRETSDTSTKSLAKTTASSKPTEWSSPLEISRNGVMSEPSHSDLESRVQPITIPTVKPQPQQVKVDSSWGAADTPKFPTKATSNPQSLIDTGQPRQYNRNQVPTSVGNLDGDVNRNDVRENGTELPTTAVVQPIKTTHLSNNNNNECVSDMNVNSQLASTPVPQIRKCPSDIQKPPRAVNATKTTEKYYESPNRTPVPEKRVHPPSALANNTSDTNNGNFPSSPLQMTTKRTANPNPSPLAKPRTSLVTNELGTPSQGERSTIENETWTETKDAFNSQHNCLTSGKPAISSQLSLDNERQSPRPIVNNNVKISQPGTKIKTNATLLLQNRNLETSRQENNTSCLKEKEETSQSHDLSKESTPGNPEKVQSPPPAITKSVHTDSPMISGLGSERTRRRILCDYKVRRDYPELFGITPRDRRTFIKSLAEKVRAEEKGLVAPYYYMTPSPLPIPKHIRNLQLQQQQQQQQQQLQLQQQQKTEIQPSNVNCPPAVVPPAPKDQKSVNLSTSTTSALSERSRIQASILSAKEAEWQAHLQKFADASALTRPKAMPRKQVSQEILEDLLEDESDCPVGLNELTRAAQLQGRQRSPEESSSNDSGISEEPPQPNKYKLTRSRLVNDKSSSSPFSSPFAIPAHNATPPSATEVTITSHFPSTSSCTSSASKKTALVCSISASAVAPLPSILKNSKVPDSFLEGNPTTSMETMVAVSSPQPSSKVDKATTTDDDLNPNLVMGKSNSRSIMAQRREAFFHGQSNSMDSPATARRPMKSTQLDENPFKVKIFPGNSPQKHTTWGRKPAAAVTTNFNSTVSSGNPWANCDRVQYTRLEKEKTARVERVESSDDSTSSDLASASPAPENENGTTDPSWSSSSSSLTGGYSSKDVSAIPGTSTGGFTEFDLDHNHHPSSNPPSSKCSTSAVVRPIVPAYYHLTKGPEIVVTKDSPPGLQACDNSEDEENDSDDNEKDSNKSLGFCNGNGSSGGSPKSGRNGGGRGPGGLLRVESNDSTVENYGDDDEEYNFEDEDEEDLSHCSLATINRYGTYESLEKIESEDTVGGLPEFPSSIPRSKARFTFDDDDDEDVLDEENLFEEDFESDFNFRFPSQIQDNTYSKFSGVSRLGPLPPLLEEDIEDDMYDENGSGSRSSPGSSTGESKLMNGSGSGTHRALRQETGLRRDNSFLLTRIATMYARSSISPLKILRELWLKKRYREWAYKE